MLRVYLLGPLALESGSLPLPRLATHKAAGLFGYLVTHADRIHSREVLASLFWPDRPPENTRRNLSTALWQIRQTLKRGGLDPSAFLNASGATVEWSSSAEQWLDVTEFEGQVAGGGLFAWQSAVRLYRGPFLEGLYDDWCIEERYRLEEQYMQALSRLAQAYAAQRDYASALHVARQMLRIDPLREDAHRLTMESLYQLGQRAAALEQYAICSQSVRTELSTEPSDATRQLHAAILSESLPRIAPAASPAALKTPDGALPDPIAGPVPFVGRAAELAALQAWWAGANPRVALVVGEAGVGKTRLAHECAATLRWRGAAVGLGRCYAFERAAPFQAVGEALRDLLRADPRQAIEALPAWARAELAWVLPELADQLAPAAPAPSTNRANLFSAIYHLLTQCAERQPVLLVLEDVHWATESTQDLLEFLAHRLGAVAGRLRVLATARQEELLPERLRQALSRLRQENLLVEWALPRLDRAAVIDWIGAWSGRAEAAVPLAEQLYSETEGNPFFITEMIKALFEGGQLRAVREGWEGIGLAPAAVRLPASVRELLQSRLDRLSPPAAELLQVAAVAGREFDLRVVQQAWGQPEDAVLMALDDLLRAHLVAEGQTAAGRDYEFTHHKIQEVAYANLGRARRQTWHRRVARAAEAEYGERAAVEILHHYRAAGEALPAVTWGVYAGQQALRLLAFGDAVRYFTQAEEQARGLDLPLETNLALYAGLAEAYTPSQAAGPINAAAEHLLILARQAGSVEREIEALLRLGRGLFEGDDLPRARQVLEQARALAEPIHDSHLLEVLVFLGVAMVWASDWGGLPILDQAAHLAEQQGQPAMAARALNAIGLSWRVREEFGRSIAAFEHGLRLAEAAGNQHRLALLWHNFADVFMFLGLPARFREALLRSYKLVIEMGIESAEDPRALGVMHHLEGNYAQARESLERALELGRQYQNNATLLQTYQNYCVLLIDLGQAEQALQWADDLMARLELHSGRAQGHLVFYRGLAHLALGQLPRAEADLLAAIDTWTPAATNQHALWWAYAALGRLYVARVQSDLARRAFASALERINAIAASLEAQPDLRSGFLNSPPVQAVRTALEGLPAAAPAGGAVAGRTRDG